MTMTTLDALSNCRSLSSLPDSAREALLETAREVRFGGGERLIPIGQPPQRLLILTDGLAKLVGVSVNGHERILYVYRPGDLVGPTVLLDNFEQDYEVTAMGGVRAQAISRRDLLAVGRRHPSIIMAVAQEVSRLLVGMTERLMRATSVEVSVRLSQLLLEFAHQNGDDDSTMVPLSFPLTQEVMAQIVGASRPHTSTVLRDLEDIGAVLRRSRRGLLVRPLQLRGIVEEEEMHEGNRLRNVLPH